MRADTISTPSVSPALTVQGRVIAALILREIHTLYGNTRLGYLWAIIQTAFGIGVFWAFREVMGAHAPHGMGMAVFLLCGFIPWYIFSDTISRCMKAVSANQALLTFPQVTEPVLWWSGGRRFCPQALFCPLPPPVGNPWNCACPHLWPPRSSSRRCWAWV